MSLVLIFCAQIFTLKFSKAASCENLTTQAARVRCARYLGWEIDKTSETVKTVYIPNESTIEFSRYNDMQKLCGFDLCPFMGKGVDCYTYRILNYPATTPVNAFLNILVYDGIMIGGDCAVEEYDDLYLPVRLIKSDAYVS